MNRTLHYASPPPPSEPLPGVWWPAIGFSLACPPLFVAYTMGVFGHKVPLLMYILVVGMVSSVVGVRTSRSHRAVLPLSVVGLGLNLLCSGTVAYLVFCGD